MVDIIVKDKEKTRQMGYKAFIGEVSKGSARPAFCNPGGVNKMQETVSDMRKNLEEGNVAPQQREQYKMNLRKHEERLSAIQDEKNNALKLYQQDAPYWDKRVEELEKEIKAETPSKKDIKDRMVNPHTVLRREMEGLREKKLEYQVIQRLRDEDSNISYLQRR
jgi:hypothetical protein